MPVDKSETRVRRMFGEIAGTYDRLNHLLSFQVDRYWRWRTVRAVPPRGDAPILDLCTGTGDLALTYAQAAPGTPIVGADFCHEMLVLAEAKRDRRGCQQIAFVEADAQHLPFPDNHFQIVCVAFGLRNVTDTDRGLREMARVCRPEGQIAVLEFSTPRWKPFGWLYGWYFRRVLPMIGQWIAGSKSQAYHYLPASVGEFSEGQALMTRMEQAGMTAVRCIRLTLGIATLYVASKAPQTAPRALEPVTA